MLRKIIFLSPLILYILFCSMCQYSYAQNQMSHTTWRSDFGTTSITQRNSNGMLNSSVNTSHKLTVVSSIFPIHEFVKKMGGDMVEALLLVPGGVEPHDFEPTINQIQTVDSADVLVYNGLDIENWIAKINTAHKIDASEGVSASYADKHNVTLDPHVWLDPLLAKKEVENIRDGLMIIDPSNKDTYFNNTKIFLNELDDLDKKIRPDLESCKKRDFISFHNSFSYFAKQYGLNQHSISNVGPEAEITPARLAEIINIAKTLGLSVIYSEELMDSRYVSVLAQEIQDGRVLVLSPIEGLTKNEQDSGIGYIDKMHENIKNLMVELECNQ
jgi:zinc transport system substrate-binding protein